MTEGDIDLLNDWRHFVRQATEVTAMLDTQGPTERTKARMARTLGLLRELLFRAGVNLEPLPGFNPDDTTRQHDGYAAVGRDDARR